MADPEPTRKAHDEHVNKDGGYGASVVSMDDPEKGSVWMEICLTCHYINTTCNHTICRWEPDPTEDEPNRQSLICQLCGIDGT